MTVTYDRVGQYIRCIKSIKKLLDTDSEFHCDIRVDTKLPKYKFWIKKLITKIIMGDRNYSYDWGGECVGKSRDISISNSASEYILICDDDDMIGVDSIGRKYLNGVDELINFNYYSTKRKVCYEIIGAKLPIIPAYWFKGNKGKSVYVGTSTIFKRSLYMDLPEPAKFQLRYVDDMVPFHVMYLKATKVSKVKGCIVKRGRNENSLMNTGNVNKLYDLVVSLSTYKSYLYGLTAMDTETKNEIWNRVLHNQITYHELKSGLMFGYILKKIFNYAE